uniref:GIY-YIG endonuclease n=1 Tax=Monilinia fructicola TaxID=38448 RepID=A0A889XQE2_MONFR|nr:GIY-YIG endonuclease [Monilinia fructicola]QRF72238.1 GIY-YIG endonuclease [Monilinia fructicola]QYB19430.1 GIY-YIG endonuclease [Monilinia fructicola]QYB19491.1 GIY-YIG endonuclease [Monilinia fructicola]QYB19553.1 GIY-YIG endonuclease [Monilinia fructicola]QYB19615.1 GIY-YIG endonuclease [Monilinia fructicola]
MVLSSSDVIVTLYGLVANKEMKDFFHIPENFNLAGIYCFLSKDGLSYYIGSSLNMRTRYNRHLYNLKQHSNKRYSEANPKFYSHMNKYDLYSLSFGCLLIIKNYLCLPDLTFLKKKRCF